MVRFRLVGHDVIEGLEARGEGFWGFYMDGLFRAWLTGEANRVARAFEVDRVDIDARYTGRSYLSVPV